MISGYKAAIFDMDGTLLDSMRYWRLGCLEYLIGHRYPVPDSILPKVFYQSGRISIMEVLNELGIVPDGKELSDEMVGRMAQHYMNDVLPKEHALDFLKKLRAQGIRCCVATASPKEVAFRALERHGFTEYLEFVYDESDAGTNKNHVEYFEGVCRKLGLPMEDCVMFEDAVYAMRTVKKTPMGLVAIEDVTARNDREEIRALADRYITGFEELL